MTESAALARELGLQLHTHLAETVEEEAFCRELFGCSPVEYLEQLGWLADDVWCAHCVHLDDGEIGRFAETGTGVAHCPSSNLRLGAGIAPTRKLLDAGVRVGLGVDGSASNERSDLFFEVKQALLVARGIGGPHRAELAGGAPARHPRRRGGARTRRHRRALARASAPTSRSGGRMGSSSPARPIPSTGSSSPDRTASTGSTSAASSSSTAGRSFEPTSERSRALHRVQARRFAP